jgi:endoglucanase
MSETEENCMPDEKMLEVAGDRFITRGGQPVTFHGVGLGGWLNMENFIVGFPSTEALNRRALREVLGPQLAQYFFDRFMEVFFTDDDAAYIASLGFNVVRIPVHYRHLEDDREPFKLLGAGFERIDRAISALAKNGVYTILDLHVLPGLQNNEWHCDNPTHHAGFWDHPHFHERVLNIWRALANRYRDNAWVAGYEPINEPGDPTGEVVERFFPQLLTAIREVDPDHILFLKGNAFGQEFGFYREPMPNTVFIAFDYAIPGAAGSGEYPGESRGHYYDAAELEQTFLSLTQQARSTGTPIWMGEFGPVYTGDDAIDESRYRVLNDQLSIYRKYGASWSIWTYKDINVQGLVYLSPESPYMTRIQHLIQKKARLAVDAWGHDDSGIRDILDPVEKRFRDEFPGYPHSEWHINRLMRHILFAEPLIPEYAGCFRGISKQGIDEVMSSFEFANCVPREPLIASLQAAMKEDASSTLSRVSSP